MNRAVIALLESLVSFFLEGGWCVGVADVIQCLGHNLTTGSWTMYICQVMDAHGRFPTMRELIESHSWLFECLATSQVHP